MVEIKNIGNTLRNLGIVAFLVNAVSLITLVGYVLFAERFITINIILGVISPVALLLSVFLLTKPRQKEDNKAQNANNGDSPHSDSKIILYPLSRCNKRRITRHSISKVNGINQKDDSTDNHNSDSHTTL